MLVSRYLIVLTRHSTLAWMIRSRELDGRLGCWAALLSNWTMEVKRCEKGEDEVLGVLAASITPREEIEKCWIKSLHERITGIKNYASTDRRKRRKSNSGQLRWVSKNQDQKGVRIAR